MANNLIAYKYTNAEGGVVTFYDFEICRNQEDCKVN
jgi:hypothetical protein